jgi:uncharacterized membrane protein
MRRPQYSSGKSSSKGCAIYLVIILLMPVMGLIMNAVNFIKDNLFWFISILIFVLFIIFVANQTEEE